ncbi:Retrovirus-related Pol polyprotein from transposon opus [Gossypium australe]|uniref:Retrovirus-related Pol polyprotein from transposon opus n=1 Tax=Gossypium australe TaxID=47621 RepID=A0A5B6VL41_9ROSI|nr:Retrovirus-related Pol polyprotein from transposon opus [Gossypium australe]
MMGDIKRIIGMGIPSNIENNPRREGKEHVKAIALRSSKVPPKLKDSRSFTIPKEIGDIHFSKALYDLRASIKLMPLSIYKKIGLRDFKNTHITLQLADRSSVHSFIISVDFVILDFKEDLEMPILLGRPFLATSKSTIDLQKNELTIRINGET